MTPWSEQHRTYQMEVKRFSITKTFLNCLAYSTSRFGDQMVVERSNPNLLQVCIAGLDVKEIQMLSAVNRTVTDK
jgi:hypothetical protein